VGTLHALFHPTAAMHGLRPALTLALAIALLAIPLPCQAGDYAEPCSGPYDWLRLNSGEWLRGDLYRVRLKSVEFWSKKLKSQSFKWKDVVDLCVWQTARYVQEDNTIVQGIGRMQDDVFTIHTPNGTVELSRGLVVAVLPGEASELQRWALKLTAGLDAHYGNTEQSALNGSVDVRREDRVTRLQLTYLTSYGTASGEENVNKHEFDARIDVWLTRRLYLTPIHSRTIYDKFQNIAVRTSPTAGGGYYIVDTGTLEIDLKGGVGYQFTRYISVGPDQSRDVSDAGFRLGGRVKWDVTGDLTFEANHDTFLVATNFGLTNYHTVASLSYDITNRLDIQFSVTHDRIREPVANSEDILPSRDDVQLIAGFGVEFR
jgi:putative salt-induced outer membrane protein YdiY